MIGSLQGRPRAFTRGPASSPYFKSLRLALSNGSASYDPLLACQAVTRRRGVLRLSVELTCSGGVSRAIAPIQVFAQLVTGLR
jgi:hypothetical protein